MVATENLLTLAGVHTHIGQYHILHGVDLEIPRGQLTMLLGRNGAGKTTTMRTIMGLWHAGQGTITYKGEDITKLRTPEIARRGIAYVPENMGVFGTLSVEENMVLAARSGDFDEARLEWIFDLFPAMQKFWKWQAGQLSGGQKQMLAIARAIIEPADLLLIDEPTKGLAPAIVDALARAIMELKKTGVTILMVEQNFGLATRVGDSVAVMDDGRIVHTGDMAELAADADLQSRFLGLHMKGNAA
ncbi:ABC transporter ATP-binding protein [Mariluticola halotolerans]|uniref:ABC transporter ATP-binding protein n=1 Tax=Mariluticola halotolerans TaxID=2909283 RepID=UPI0026E48455|nr:ABC transporter ATP-binding protein [Mariluticola halotolerans]UJQ96113.1 ABC transporter ATP-binding protein [Mariluticola halotolerans]